MSIPCSRSRFSLNTSEKNPRESTWRTGVISLMSAISVTATCILASSPSPYQIRLHKSPEKEKDADRIGLPGPAEINPRPHDLAEWRGCYPIKQLHRSGSRHDTRAKDGSSRSASSRHWFERQM